MRNDRLSRELDLLLMLASTDDYTVDEICRETGFSRRTFYYDLECLRENGFDIFKRNNCYHIDQRSPFLNRLLHLLQFNEEEAVTLRKLIELARVNNPIVHGIRHKLDRFYDFSILSDMALRQKAAAIVSTLYDAIKEKHVVKICGYSSPHSQSVSDRYVEPYKLMNNNNDVRCYEIATASCKTFRVSRMEHVEKLDLLWSAEDQHRQIYTDLFMFSGEERYPVKLRLGRLAYNVFMEEHPDVAPHMQPDGDNHWRLQLEVCDYRGIGRFILGLFQDIEILGDSRFQQYIRDTILMMAQKEGMIPTLGGEQ